MPIAVNEKEEKYLTDPLESRKRRETPISSDMLTESDDESDEYFK